MLAIPRLYTDIFFQIYVPRRNKVDCLSLSVTPTLFKNCWISKSPLNLEWSPERCSTRVSSALPANNRLVLKRLTVANTLAF